MATSGWTYPDPIDDLAAGTLQNRGMTILRADTYLHQITVPVATAYTAPTIAAVINATTNALTATVYRTSQLRVDTNSFDISGDIMLVASDAEELDFAIGDVSDNLVGHLASVEAINAGVGSPHDFQLYLAGYSKDSENVDSVQDIFIPDAIGRTDPPSTGYLVGLRRWDDGLSPIYWQDITDDEVRIPEYSNIKGFRSAVATRNTIPGAAFSFTDAAVIGLRSEPFNQLLGHSPIVFASPYAMGANDSLTAVVDQDTDSKRFVIPMFRRLKPTSAVYGVQNAFVDVDGGNATLGTSFGIDYDFNDFAVFMQARVQSHIADAAKRVLWRYFRHGPEGAATTVRYMAPTGPDTEISFDVEYSQAEAPPYFTKSENTYDPIQAHTFIYLSGGATKTGSIVRNSSSIGLARVGPFGDRVYDVWIIGGYSVVESERTGLGANGNRLKLQVPGSGVAMDSTGFSPGDTLWFEAANPDGATLFSGNFTITQVDAFDTGDRTQDIYFLGSALNDGGTATYGPTVDTGTVSKDTLGEVSFDPAIATDDWVRLGASFDAGYRNNTMQVIASDRQYIQLRAPDITGDASIFTPEWIGGLNPDHLVIFEKSTQTAQQLVDALEALNDIDTVVPVSGTVVGSGSGIINRPTWYDLDEINAAYQLSDGINYVQRTIEPPSIATNTQFMFRDQITSGLINNSDWINEDVRLVPVLTESVAQWLNTLAVTGLSSVAEIRASSNGTKIQISSDTIGSGGAVQIQGGTANLTACAVTGTATIHAKSPIPTDTVTITVRAADAIGLVGNTWAIVENTNSLPKPLPFIDTDEVIGIEADGTWTFDAPPYTVTSDVDLMRVVVEKVGNFVALHFPNQLNTVTVDDSYFTEDGYIYLTTTTDTTTTTLTLPQIASANQGVFKILRTSVSALGLTLWIENLNVIEQVALCHTVGLGADNIVPGDTWTVSTTRFGVNNRRTFTVAEVGSASVGVTQYQLNNIRVDITDAPVQTLVSAVAFGTDLDLVQIREGQLTRLTKKILTIAPNVADGQFVDVQLNNVIGSARISAASGSILKPLNKFEFDTGIKVGVDGYRYNTGLVGESNRIVYGDPSDEATYSGYAANGATILIQGPTVKRIQIALALRVQSGLATQDLADRVRSSVASKINQTPVGTPVALSDIVSAAQDIPGVVAVSVIKPTYTSTNDLLPVQPFEKPLVLNIRDDISISFVGI